MRILMIAPAHVCWDPRVVMRESRTLAGRGHQVGVIAMADPAREFPDGLELLPLEYKPRTRWQRIALIPQVYRLARDWAPDVYHAHELESLTVGVLLKWRTGAKLIFDSHECYHHSATRHLRGWRARVATFLTTRVLRFLARRADHVIVVSFTNEHFYRDACGCRNVTIIHNSPHPELFPCIEKSAAARNTVTHTGNFTRDRGMEQTLRALALVKARRPVRFLVFGMTRENERAELERMASELGIAEEVEVVPWLEYDRLGLEMNRGSIGLMALQPTLNNMFTLHNKLFHYMATGQAVIGPAGSDTECVIRQADCGLAIDTTDPTALADAITSLLRDPERCWQLGLNGRRAIETEYGWHRMEEKLAHIYAGLDSRSTPTANADHADSG